MSNKKKTPRRYDAQEVRKLIKEYLNKDFSYNQLANRKERMIYRSGFWSGTQFLGQFKDQREMNLKAADNNGH